MIIDGKGCDLVGANIVLTFKSRLYNMNLFKCDIDDIYAPEGWAINCRLVDCRLRSQYDPVNSLDIG